MFRKFPKQYYLTVFDRNLEKLTFIKSVSEISGLHFATVFRRNLGQYRSCFGNFWSNILSPSVNKFCMKIHKINSVLKVSETHSVTRISSVFLRLKVFRKFQLTIYLQGNPPQYNGISRHCSNKICFENFKSIIWCRHFKICKGSIT